MAKNQLDDVIVAVKFLREGGTTPVASRVEQVRAEVTWDGGGTTVLFYYLPTEASFTPEELVGKTGREALELYKAKGAMPPAS